MTEIIKETNETENLGEKTVLNNPTGDTSKPIMATQIKTAATNSQTVEYLIYFFFGALDILIAFRVLFMVAGASAYSGFVRLIYAVTGVFILPFEGIFSSGVAQGLETTSILEPAAIIAFIFYGVLAWGIVKLVRILSGEQQA